MVKKYKAILKEREIKSNRHSRSGIDEEFRERVSQEIKVSVQKAVREEVYDNVLEQLKTNSDQLREQNAMSKLQKMNQKQQREIEALRKSQKRMEERLYTIRRRDGSDYDGDRSQGNSRRTSTVGTPQQ